jgi:hypothetical protein
MPTRARPTLPMCAVAICRTRRALTALLLSMYNTPPLLRAVITAAVMHT